MTRDRILALDLGEKRVGLALSDPLGFTAQPLPYLPFSGLDRLIHDLDGVIREKSVSAVLIGLAKNPDGSEGPRAAESRKAGEKIEKACRVPVRYIDETFTSRDAEEFLIRELDVPRKKRREIRDSLSACLILRSYIEAHERSGT
ncbi:MAG: hypothetical protein A2636_04220 [Elusimicrobia bacterium RIFCSPHIGHO2_01_FULL_64_10]|nr:MAG: hypothetical protein A2636_04220 [Elusimicrobia bacterium RIFCSPHIGHO2_01_FULL_64_10]